MKSFLAVLFVLVIFASTLAAQEEYSGTVLKVTDGDTMTVKFALGMDVFTEGKIRLKDIDCPEIRTEAGKAVRDDVRGMLEGQNVRIEVYRKDKYGRWLAVVWFGSLNVNEWLLQTGRAKPYDGRKRLLP